MNSGTLPVIAAAALLGLTSATSAAKGTDSKSLDPEIIKSGKYRSANFVVG
jgi:hypothetical protein